jgi:hypothetical protein
LSVEQWVQRLAAWKVAPSVAWKVANLAGLLEATKVDSMDKMMVGELVDCLVE